MPYRTALTPEFIVEKTETNPVTGCWIWTMYLDPRGYPTLGDNPNGQRFAHRLSFELFNGPIPDDMTVDHICFQTNCVNPEHLQLLPNEDNARRKEDPAARAWRLANQIEVPDRSDECRNGHTRTVENTRMRADGAGRYCLDCQRETQRNAARRRGIKPRAPQPACSLCGEKSIAKSLCHRHYSQQRRAKAKREG